MLLEAPMFDFPDSVALAVITVLGTLIVGLIGAFAYLWQRIGKIETDLSRQRDYNHRLWAYCRKLLDLYYRHRREGAPDPDELPEEP